MNPKVVVALAPFILMPIVSLVRAENTPESIPPLISDTKPKPEMPQEEEAPISCADLQTCEGLLRQAVAELEHWRGTGAAPQPAQPVLPAPTGLPAVDALIAASKGAPTTPEGAPTPPPTTPSPAPAQTTPSAPGTSEQKPEAVAPSSPTIPVPPSFAPEDLPRLAQVASVVKGMKPREAAEVITRLDEGFAVAVLARLPNRNASALTASLAPELASRLLSRLARLKLESAVTESPTEETP